MRLRTKRRIRLGGIAVVLAGAALASLQMPFSNAQVEKDSVVVECHAHPVTRTLVQGVAGTISIRKETTMEGCGKSTAVKTETMPLSDETVAKLGGKTAEPQDTDSAF